jgi:hypothetical protein
LLTWSKINVPSSEPAMQQLLEIKMLSAVICIA